MNNNLLESISKLVAFICAIVTLFFEVDSNVNEKFIFNINLDKNENIVNEVIPYETEYRYNSKLPVSISRVVQMGVDGIYNKDEDILVVEKTNEIIEIGTASEGKYTGRLTNYGADCPGCSSVGNVACLTREGTKHSLINHGITYNDSEFGELRILAADFNLFSCGTILLVEDTMGNVFEGIVLDTGGSMRKAYKNGEVWLDLASKTESEASLTGIGGYNVNFTVERWGW